MSQYRVDHVFAFTKSNNVVLVFAISVDRSQVDVSARGDKDMLW